MKSLTIVSENKLEIIEKEVPTISTNQVLVKVAAAALNKRDQFISEGKYPGIQLGATLGSDGVGEIVEVGADIESKNIGRQVIINPNINWGNNPTVQSQEYNILGMPSDGTFAEYVAVGFDRVHDIPKNLKFEEAVALPLAGLTAFRACFHHGQIKAEDNVLISGFGGGVAQYAFQYAVASKSKVYVTSSSDIKMKEAIELGAVETVNYKSDNWQKTLAKKSGGFDVVIDSAGGDQINDFVKMMKPGGRIVFYGATTGLPSSLDLYRMFWNQITLQGSTMGNDQEFAYMLNFVEVNNIHPLIDSSRSFDEILDAIAELRQGDKLGKLVLKF